MPPSAHTAPNGAKPKPPNAKGKPLGIPTWGWIAAAVVGIIIGWVLIKNRSTNAAGSGNGTESAPSPSGTTDSGSGGGVVASPPSDNFPALLAQAGLGSNGEAGQTTSNPSGDTSVDPFSEALAPPGITASNPPIYFANTAPFASGNPSGPGPVNEGGGYSAPSYAPSSPVTSGPASSYSPPVTPLGHGAVLTG